MRTTRTLIAICCALSLGACGSTPPSEASPEREPVTEAEPTAEPSAATTPDQDRDERYADAPDGTATLASLLMARHTEDLPDAETFAAHSNAEAALLWLVDHGDRLVLRVRALGSLRFFSSAEVRAAVLRFLADEGAHPTLRAAAATGSGGVTLDDDLRAALETARANGDRRVEHAVDERLAATADGSGALGD